MSMNRHRQVNQLGRNWIGKLRGNVFLGRGKHNLLSNSNSKKEKGAAGFNALTWNEFLATWMDRKGIDDDANVTYQMIADARAE